MSMIYGVYENGGLWEDSYHTLLKCFKNVKKAENYMKELEAVESATRYMRDKCENCNGYNKDCPLWMEPYNKDDECQNYSTYTWHDNKDYSIEEVELVE